MFHPHLLKETFSWISFFILFSSSPSSHFPKGKVKGTLAGLGKGLNVFPLMLLSPLPTTSAAFPRVLCREQMAGGYQGPKLCSVHPSSREASGYKQYRTPEVLHTPQIRKMARTTTTTNLQFTIFSSQYLLLMMPQALVLPDKICPLHRLAKFQSFPPSLLQSRE